MRGPLVQGQDSQGGSDECECSALDYWQTTPNHGLEKSHYAGDKKYGGDYVAASWVIISEVEKMLNKLCPKIKLVLTSYTGQGRV